MRQRILLLLFILATAGSVSFGQSNTVRWKYSVVKKADKTFELHAIASIDEGWHVYSQTTPPGGPNPTVFHFGANPLITIEGSMKESGKMKKRFETVFKVDVKYYEGKVEFIQPLKLKSNVKTKLTGTINYMICNDEMCLPPQTEKFDIMVG